MDDPKDLERLDNFLLLNIANREHENYLYKMAGTRLIGSDIFRNVINYVTKRLSCKSILIEEQYIDADYRNEFSNLYSKTFAKYESYSTRLHFFGKFIRNIAYLKDYVTSSDTVDYLGYTVLRPISIGKVGRTVLCAHKEADDIFYPLCVSNFKVHLFGKELSVTGSPFISQDSMVMACAQAAIWTAALYLHQELKFSRFLPFDITENASKSLSWIRRTLPTEGLTVFQMINALNNMGYSPILFSKPLEKDYHDKDQYKRDDEEWDPLGFIYSYIESRIPVLVSVPDHAITVIGHTFDPAFINLQAKIIEKREKHKISLTSLASKTEKLIFPSSILTNGFIVQDDNLGPYRILPVKKSDYESFQNSRDLLPIEKTTYSTVDDIEHVIVPLPEKIYLMGNQAYIIAREIFDMRQIMQYLNRSLDNGSQSAKEIITGMDPENDSRDPVIIRCYFMDSSEYKRSILHEPNLHDKVRSSYIRMRLPHYIWIAEITTVKYLCKRREHERRVLGEIIIDSTANKYDSTTACLSIHLPGFLLIQNQETRVFNDPIFLDADHPYRHPSRKMSK